jgi:membrane protein insertase Oxa1/YidC/SpoIIIJ
MLLKVMPAFFAAISLGIPAAVVVYFLVSNLFRIGQQALITKTMYSDGGALASMPGGSAAKAPSGVLGLLGFGTAPSKNGNVRTPSSAR